jgi:hypothetical protein
MYRPETKIEMEIEVKYSKLSQEIKSTNTDA